MSEELVKRFKAGDDAAFEALFNAHRPAALRVARTFFKSEADQEDAVQEAYIAVLLGIDGFAGGNFEAWLVRIVQNKCRDLLRKKKSDPIGQRLGSTSKAAEYAEEAELMALAAEDDDHDPRAHVDVEEEVRRREEVTAVPGDQPAVVAAMYLAALAYPQHNKAAHTRRDRLLMALAHAADRQGRALGLKSPNRLTLPAANTRNTVNLAGKRLDRRLTAARVAVRLFAGWRQPTGEPWTLGAVLAGQRSKGSWHRDIWQATLPALHLAWALRPVVDVERRYPAMTSKAMLALLLEPEWALPAVDKAERMAELLPQLLTKATGQALVPLNLRTRLTLQI